MENIQILLLLKTKFEANFSGRQLYIIILIRFSIRNLNFTIEKLKKSIFLVVNGDNLLSKITKGG